MTQAAEITNRDAPDWREVLRRTREYNRARTGRYDLRPWYRTRARRENPAATEGLSRALAFTAVLDGVNLHVYPGERLVGSRAGFAADALPASVSEADYRQAVEEDRTVGQRDFIAGWDHTLADYPTLLAEGVGGILARIDASLDAHSGAAQRECLRGMRIAVEAFSRWIARHAEVAADGDLAAALRRIAHQPPATFREGLQLVWLTHLAFVSQGRYANALGRIDQYMLPLYERDVRAGRLDRDGALELLCDLWAHVEELGEVTNICVGGLTPDGRDATNELSYLAIEATRLVQSPHTNLSARFHDDTPDAFHRACFECVRTGVGFPAIFNDHVLLAGLGELGVPAKVARDHCMVGCIETMLPGRQPPWSDSRFNAPLPMLRALRQLAAEAAPTWERLLEAFSRKTRDQLREHARSIDAHVAAYPVERFADPFLSALTRDCIARGRDVNDGGAEFPRFHGIAIMGLATVADSLAAVRRLVFEEKRVSLPALVEALDADFARAEPLRQTLLTRAPKYGNADPQVDEIAAWFVDLAAAECLQLRMAAGGRFLAAMAANVQNISAGREVGATPDGRRAGTPLSDAASPYFGRDLAGPTAFLRSVAQPDYHRVVSGSVINMKFEPALFADEGGAERFGALTRFFVRERIPELQFNFTGTETLADAREHPERHASLVVRVSGFSAYFTRLARDVQDDIIRRRAHGPWGPRRVGGRRGAPSSEKGLRPAGGPSGP